MHPYLRSPLPSPILRTSASAAGRNPAQFSTRADSAARKGIKGLNP